MSYKIPDDYVEPVIDEVIDEDEFL